jgi:hypothetical protein
LKLPRRLLYERHVELALTGERTNYGFPLQREFTTPLRKQFPIEATFAFKSRTNFSSNFVLDLSTKLRDLSAATMQLNPGKSLRIKKRQSGI